MAARDEYSDEELEDVLALIQQQEHEEQQGKIKADQDIIRDVDREYYESLLEDQTKDFIRNRQTQRQSIQELLETKLPRSAIEVYPVELQRLLRINPRYLETTPRPIGELLQTQEALDLFGDEEITISQKGLADILRQEINRIQEGGCLDPNVIDDPYIFKTKIGDIPYNLCFNVEDLFEQGLVNVNMGLADLNIELPETGEVYLYPLPDQEAQRLIDQARKLGLSVYNYPQLVSPEMSETLTLLNN